MLAGDAVDRAGLRRFEPADPQVAGIPLSPRLMGAILATAIGASLVNPYGPHVYARIIDVAGQADHTAIVDELQPLDLTLVQGQLLLLCTGLFLLTLLRFRRAASTQEILHIVVFTAMAVIAGRLILWAALFHVLILPRALYQLWCDLKATRPGLEPILGAAEEFRPMIMAMLVLYGVGMSVAVPDRIAPLRMGLCEPLLPGLHEIAALRRPGDRMFNDDKSGSCMLLIDPKAKLFIDTRFDFYGEAFLAEAAYTMSLQADWRETFARWDIDSAVVTRDWPLARALEQAADFEKLFDDGTLAYYRRGTTD